jgi:hypothetical protein
MAWRVEPTIAALRNRVREGRVPSWLLGGGIALLTWWWQFVPPAPGVDHSWQLGLLMASERGLDFGTEVIFTFGPLGFLHVPLVGYADLAVLTFLYQAALYVALATALVWALRASLPMLAAAVVAYLAIAVLPAIEIAIAVPAIVCLGLLGRDRSDLAIVVLAAAGAVYAALEQLGKISHGPVIFAICLLALIGMRARWWQLAAYVAAFAGAVLLLWVATGQSLSDLPDFVRNGREIVSGYSEAMAVSTAPGWQAPVAALALAATVAAAAAFGRFPDGRARWCAAALVGIAAFLMFKEGVVRYTPGRLTAFFATACVLWLAIPWSPARRGALAAGALALAALTMYLSPTRASPGLNAIANLRLVQEQARTLVSPRRRGEVEEEGRDAMRATYRLGPRILAGLRGHTVSIDPWEIGVAWAYDLNWSPLPIFQNYSAYTTRLDELNAAALASREGPERVLRENPREVYPEFATLNADGRFFGWDPPAQARALLCNFVPLVTTKRWQLLARVGDRCGAARPIGGADAAFGESVAVPAAGPGEVVFARIDGADVEGLERLRAVLLRAKLRHAVVNESKAWRIVPGTASDGLLLRGDPRLAVGGVFSLIPQARTIELTGAGGDLRFEFFRMEVAGGRAQPDSSRAIASRASSGSSTTRSPAPRRISRTR